jgi:thiol-disulfide isomerase/thioredoxin
MKKLLPNLLLVLAILSFASCGKDNSSNDAVGTVPATPQSLTITADKTRIAADGVDNATFTVKDAANVDVTASASVLVNGQEIPVNNFATKLPGSYQVKAQNGGLVSPVINIIAENAAAPVFTQKTIAEFFTGTWCGICPGTLMPLDKYTADNPSTIMIGIHGPKGSDDPFQYEYDPQLRSKFNINGVPTVLLNRNGFWDGNTSKLDQLASNNPLLGVGIATSINGNKIAVKTSVRFGSAINAPLKLVVMLVEDNVPYNQANYGHFNLPNPIKGFIHHNILRNTATDIFGDEMPAAAQTKDNIWEKDFTIDATGTQLNRARIVAFVLYDSNASSLRGVLNAQVVNAGQTENF